MKSKRLAKIILTLFTFLFLFFQYGIQEAQAWWNSNYSYRKPISVTNNDSVQLAANTIVSFTADTQTLISGSKLRSDGKDWRIVYYNGSTESEIAQLVEAGWNTSSTETWFRLQAAINAGATSYSYYVYYGYSSESTSPSTFTTTEQTLTQQLVGSGQRDESFDWNSTPEYGSAQQVSIGAGTSRYWKITRFSIFVNHKTGSTCSNNDIAGFIFSTTNKREGDQVTNGKSDLKDGDTFSAGAWNDLSWSGDKPKIKTGTWYIAVLPTNPAQRSASGCYIRWDFTAVEDYLAYEIQKDSSTWLTTYCADKERAYKVYGREAANSDLSAALGVELTPTAVLLSSFTATAFDTGKVLLKWKTGYEVNNLGFHVYREEGGQLYELTSEPIKGSALLTGHHTATAGYSYTWWDTSAIADVQGSLTLKDRPSASRTVPPTAGLEANNPSASSEELLKRRAPQAKRSVLPPSSKLSALRYWLEDIDLNGTKTMHGPVTPVFSNKPAPKKAQSILLSQINKQDPGIRSQESGVRNQESGVRNQHPAVSGRRSAPPPLPSPLEGEGGGGGASSRALLKPGGPRANISVSSVDDRNETPAGRKISAPLSDKPLKKSPEVQQALAGSRAVKIYIQEEGWYRVTQPELVAAGLDPAVNPRFLQLFVGGEEQPMLVKGGRDDRLGPRDSIEFYAQGLDTPHTDTRVYWLVPGLKPGKRIHRVDQDPGRGRVLSSSFPYTVEKKDRTIYVAALKNGDASNFFGPVVSATPLDQVLKVSHLDSSAPGDALLEVSLQGVTAGAHQVMVMVNGVVVGTMVFEGQTVKAERFPLVQAGLVEGENVVTLVSQGVPLDVSLVDSIRLTYWRTYTAEEELLKFTSVGGNHLSVNGFSSSSIRVVDITDLQNLKELGGAVKGEGGGYSFRFRVPGQGQRTLLAFVDEEARTPAALELNQPSRWHRANQSADLVMISHGYFLESLKPLKAWRESQGLSVALIDVEDLYDEFSFGIKTPRALKDFLFHAKSSWQRPPRFVLLVGDASFDPRNYYGFGHFDYVPTKLVDTNYIETASDDWFVDFNSDGLPDMAIGRLPVRTAEEAASVVSKLIGYEQLREPMKDVLLVADMRDKDFDYMAASVGVKALLPGSLNVSEVYRDQFPDDVQVKTELLRRLNQGPLLVNYIGHGTLEFWRGDVFGSDDAEVLTNGLRLPLVIGMTCLTGFFQDVYYETLAESLLKAKDGGAVAVWTSSGLTEPDRQAVMNKEMIRLLFNGQGLTIGEAVQKAKAATTDADVRKTWILFGDPTTRLKP